MPKKYYDPLSDMSRIKTSLMSLFCDLEDITRLIMPHLDDENFTWEQNWYGGAFDKNIKGQTEIKTLIGHCFDTPYIDGTVTDNRCAIFIETYLISVNSQHIKEVGVDIMVVCHKDSVRLSKEDTKYYESIGVYGNRVDSAIQIINSSILNHNVMKKIKQKYSIGDINLLERAPLQQYVPGTKFYGKVLHYTYQNFYQRKNNVGSVMHLKLNYFELLSPDPIYIQEVGSIISPTLKNISSIGINTYQYYLSILLMDLRSYFKIIDQENQYEALSNEEKMQISIFDVLTMNDQSANLLQSILNFFIKENVVYSPQNKCFFVQDSEEIIGIISKEIYPQICDLIFQRNCIKSNPEEDLSKIKSKKALEIMKKLQKGRAEKSKGAKTDKNMELGNIISAVANKSNSLNILNIWDLTVFQVWDCFSRLSNNSIYDIQSMSVAAWGNKDNYFDKTAWFKRMDTNS